MNQDHSVISETVPKYCISDSFVNYEGYSTSSKGFLPTVAEIMVVWIKIAGRNNNNLRYADETTLMAESEEELKNLLMKVQRGE